MLRLDQKLNNIRSGRYERSDFIIADAKDGDMGYGVGSTGLDHRGPGEPRRRTRAEFIDQIQQIVEQDIVDIMLVSVSNLELLQERGVFDDSRVKPAVRVNDTTDCWGGVRHGTYRASPSRPFRSASIPRAMALPQKGTAAAKIAGTDLGLYSITFMNDLDLDLRALEAFAAFRQEALANGFRYFYEVFNPNLEIGLSTEQLGEYVNDSILRSLAGLTRAERPEFLKIVYNGPKALEELAVFDPQLVVGVLGGGAGTTRDTFELLHQAERFGGRLALFGRKINLAEAPLPLIALMREVVEGAIGPEEAVRAYHGALQKQGLRPVRSLEDDRVVSEAVLQAAASPTRR